MYGVALAEVGNRRFRHPGIHGRPSSRACPCNSGRRQSARISARKPRIRVCAWAAVEIMGRSSSMKSNNLLALAARVELGNPVRLHVVLKDSVEVSFPLDRILSFCRRPAFRKLLQSRDAVLGKVAVQDFGHTIEWPDLGLDFSVAEMLPEFLGIATVVAAGRTGGRKKTPAKVAAARANGAKGGRPRKRTAA
jgi:hypothetical protein